MKTICNSCNKTAPQKLTYTGSDIRVNCIYCENFIDNIGLTIPIPHKESKLLAWNESKQSLSLILHFKQKLGPEHNLNRVALNIYYHNLYSEVFKHLNP